MSGPSLKGWLPTTMAVLALMSLSLAGCNKTTAPSQVTASSPQELLQVFGNVFAEGPSGRPLANADVSVLCGSKGSTGRSGADGGFGVSVYAQIPPQCSQLQLTIFRVGYALSQQMIAVAADGPRTFRLDAHLATQTEELAVGATAAGQVEPGLPFAYLGEPYESAYSTAFRSYGLNAAAATDVVLELRWAGTPEMDLWLTDGFEVSTSTPVAAGVKSIVLPAGHELVIVVGTPSPVPAPTTPIPFTLSAIAR